jgi:hypothetical protein
VLLLLSPCCCCCQVNKEDLLSMVRYGAELVFSSEASNITGKRIGKFDFAAAVHG